MKRGSLAVSSLLLLMSAAAAQPRKAPSSAAIVNTATGEVTSHVIRANTEGDFH